MMTPAQTVSLLSYFSLIGVYLICVCTHHMYVRCARQSPRRPPPVRPDVTDDARVDGGNEQNPEIQRQMDELDRHRQTVKKMSYKIIDLHAKVYITLHLTVGAVLLKSSSHVQYNTVTQERVTRPEQSTTGWSSDSVHLFDLLWIVADLLYNPQHVETMREKIRQFGVLVSYCLSLYSRRRIV